MRRLLQLQHELLIKKSDMRDELFARQCQFHPVTNTATRHDVFRRIPLRGIDPIYARVLHFGQPFSVRPSGVRGWLSAVVAILLDYFCDLFDRKRKFAPELFSPATIFTVNPARPGLGRTLAGKADTTGKPTILPITARPSIPQVSNGDSFFSSASATHPPKACRNRTPLSGFSRTRTLVGNNRKMPQQTTRKIDKLHNQLCHVVIGRER